ncbi:MAG: hypothetical protein LAP38_23165 [Acidobacteriia bacterium]|nr:hypothetical protein [Terriglobia bacterium]
MTILRADLYTKSVLTAIAVLLGVLALRPVLRPIPAQAQSEGRTLYIEPGVTMIRKPDGSSLGDGKMVVDLKSGDVWGFPTMVLNARYPVDVSNSKPAVSKPVYLGRFDFSSLSVEK